MAVQFQRRNVGALMELPTFEDVGMSAYQDYSQGGGLPALAEEAVQGEVLPPESPDQLAAAEDAAAQLIAAAERQRQAAGNPLNRGLSALGGIIGAPFNFLGAALGGGDMSAVTAPFRPQQAADMRYQQQVFGIQDKLAEIRKDYASMANSRTAAVREALGAGREAEAAGYDDLGRLTSSMLFMTPEARAQQAPALLAIARRYSTLAPAVQDLIDGGFDDASLIAYGSMSKDEGARQRVGEYAYGNKQTSLGDGLGVTTYSRPGLAPQVFGPGMSISAPPAIGGRPTAPVTSAAAPAPVVPVGVPARAVNGAATTPQDLIGLGVDPNSIPMGNPLAPPTNAPPAAPTGAMPSLDEIEAELKRRGVQ